MKPIVILIALTLSPATLWAAGSLQCIGRCHDRTHACLRTCHTVECQGRCHDQLNACVRRCPSSRAAFDIRTFGNTAE